MLSRIALSAVQHLEDQGAIGNWNQVHRNDQCITYFADVPDLCKIPVRISLVMTTDQRIELVLVTSKHGHFLLDVTDRQSGPFCGRVIERWLDGCIQLKNQMASPHWEFADHYELDAEMGGD